jgi:hypothetical protein
MMRMKSLASLLFAAIVAVTASAVAQTPSDLSDLVNARASSAEGQVMARGYRFTRNTTGDNSKVSFWWNDSRKQCVSIATINGVFASIVSTAPRDCNQGGAGYPNGSGYGPGDQNSYGGDRNSVTCSSDDGGRHYCGSYPPDRVRLDRQISGSPCNEGQTWGVDNRGLWVDRGCRATFVVRGHSDDHGGYDNGSGDSHGDGYNGYYGSNQINNYPRVRVDTSGHGSYQGRHRSANITRGWVDTSSDRPSVALSGDNDFRITFYGNVVRSDGNHVVMEITGTDRGSANGHAEFRLNGDRNEVDMITVNGSGFSGNFNR